MIIMSNKEHVFLVDCAKNTIIHSPCKYTYVLAVLQPIEHGIIKGMYGSAVVVTNSWR